MKVLVACEESQTVTKEFRRFGHEAYSCDLQDCSGGHPEWHIKGDVLQILNDDWDLMIAHPPCTFLSNSSVCHLYTKKERWKDLIDGAVFFRTLLNADIPMVCVENPIQHKYARQIIGYKGEPQIIQPYQFGHTERKATCLWLKGLPNLYHTINVYGEMIKLPKNKQQRLHYLPPSKDMGKLRSKTYEGIAQAMAEQWGGLLKEKRA